MPRLPGFIGPSYRAPSIVAASDQCINWIPAKIESGTGANGVLYVFDPAPGFPNFFTTGGDGAFRASATLNQDAYFISGTKFFGVTNVPTSPSVLGSFTVGGTAPTPASIAPGGFANNQVLMSNGVSDIYWYDTVAMTNGQITTIRGNVVAFLNGYFLALDNAVAQSTLYFSALEDGTSWDPADAIQRNDLGDLWRTMIVKQNEIWLFGSQSTSVYFPVDADPPFAPNLNVTVTRGIRADASLRLLQGSPIWLADDLTVRYANGYNPVRVSNHALEYIWSQYTQTADADAFVQNDQGHTFYVLNFPTANQSWAFDVTTGMWHQRGPYVSMTDTFSVLPVCYGVQIPLATATGVTAPYLVGSRTDNKFYYYSQAYSTEIDGTTQITRRRRAPNMVNDLKRVRYANFELFAEVGVITPTPTVTLQYSDNGGQTFTTGNTVSAGALTDYSYRIRWAQSLGQGRNRCFQVTTASPLRLVDALVDISVGAS